VGAGLFLLAYGTLVVEGEEAGDVASNLFVPDTLTKAERSRRMSLIRGKDTSPELIVRRLLFAMGYRYRLHVKSLPGSPDIVLARYHAVVLVHGCFWHRHQKRGCRLARLPKSGLDFWLPKLESNRLRDIRVKVALRRLGWRVAEVWECELKNPSSLQRRLRYFLDHAVS
jgi:DNA mismatch endonuclease (patch repair protein)